MDLETTTLFVAPEVARQGVGRALIMEIESRAVDKGYKVMGLHAGTNAVKFYKACGMTVVSDIVTLYNGAYFQEAIVMKHL